MDKFFEAIGTVPPAIGQAIVEFGARAAGQVILTGLATTAVLCLAIGATTLLGHYAKKARDKGFSPHYRVPAE